MEDELDRLERLSRLRDSGVLTDEEFQGQKARILAGAAATTGPAYPAVAPPTAVRPPWLWIATGIMLLVVVVAIASLIGRSAVTDGNFVATENGAAAAVDLAEPTPAATVARAVAGTDYAWATSFDVIDANPAYLRQRLGPPERDGYGLLAFVVDGCPVTYQVEDRRVTSATVAITAACAPTIAGDRMTSRTTFGQVFGSYQAACLEMCGNAAEPTLDKFAAGSRATGDIDILYSAVGPLDAWATALRRAQGLADTDPLDATGCNAEPPPGVAATFDQAPIETVQFGRGLATGCSDS